MPLPDAHQQSDPDCNAQFRRWPPPATGDDACKIRAWHAADMAPPPMSRARRAAEAAWRRITRRAVVP